MIAPDIDDIYELSPLQQGMLFHTLLAPHAALYFEQSSVAWPGLLNVAALTRAWKQVIERHAALRTSFHWEDLEKPLQVVHRDVTLPIELLDWRHLSPTEQQAAFEAYLQADRARGFDLTDPPLMRLALIRWRANEHQLLVSVHHMVMDGWSMQIAFKDFLACYAAACEGTEARLDPCRPYSDYIAWLQRQDLSSAETFWRQRLVGFAVPTRIPIDDAPGSQADDNGEFVEREIRLSQHATAALQAVARERQLTLNTIVQGAWAIVLHRYSGDEAVMFGSVVSGRPGSLRGADGIVGLFLNVLAVPTRVQPYRTVVEYLRELQAQRSEASQFEYTPLVEVQGWSGIPRGTPLFDSLLVFENYPLLNARAANVETPEGVRQPRHIARTNVALTVLVSPGDTLSIKVLSDSKRFAPAAVARLLGHVETLLNGIARGMDEPIRQLPMVTAAERQQLVTDWNDTAQPYPPAPGVVARFDAMVARCPDAVAVMATDEGEALTFAALARRAAAVAHALATRGVGREMLVALAVPRSVDAVAALLGIFKAGAACLPLDPSVPPARLAAILQDAAPRAVLTDCRSAGRLPALDVPVMQLEDLAGGSDPAAAPAVDVDPTALAYVIYTSGSTGGPKGVALTHGQILNRLHWMWTTYPFAAGEVACQKTGLTFIDAVWEVLGALLCGVPTLVVPDAVVQDPPALVAQLARHGVTRLWLVPSALRALLDAVPDVGARLPALRFWVSTGEPLDPALVAQFRTQLPGAVLYNLYGTSEVWDATWYDTTRETPLGARVPIGTPLGNVRVYVLDAHGALVPIGVPGELHVGGAGIGPGYLHRPALTAERFIPDPFGGPGARLYRTGDRVRYRRDGALEFLDRLDHQIKIRGYRVELAEVERALASHPAVLQFAVVVGDDDTDTRLVAYLIPADGQRPSADYCRRFLEQRLPRYMVPAAFVPVSQLPRTPSGKLDRRALAAFASPPDNATPFVAPATDTERIVASIFTEVLGAKEVSAHADFFADLGGHSLLATQLMSRIGSRLGVELPLRRLFDLPTVAGLSQAIDRLRAPIHAAAAGAAGYEEGEL